MTQPPAVNPYSAPPAGGTDVGRVGFVFAIVAVGLAVAQQVSFAFLPSIQTGVGFGTVSLWIGAFNVVHLVVSLAALVLGAIGAQRRQSLVQSGIAIGVGGAGVIVGVIGFAIVPLIGLLL